MNWYPTASSVKTVVDLHGWALEEALHEVDKELNHSFCQDSEDRRIEFVTGWGAVLRPKIREYLRTHPLVKELQVCGPSIRVHLEDKE